MAKVFVFDISLCNGCRCCQIACKDEMCGQDWVQPSGTGIPNYGAGQYYSLAQPDTGQFWIQVNDRVRGTVPKVKVAYIPTMCNHCDNAPCIKAATGGAIYKVPSTDTQAGGLVIIDPTLSVGQKNLVNACPYGAIFWNSTSNIPQKCDGCAHLLEGVPNLPTPVDPGLTVPRCVDACPTGALTFQDDTDSATQALIAQAEVMNPEYDTQPRVYYLNLPKFFIAGALADPVEDECVEGATVTATDLTSGTVYTATSDNYGDFWFEGMQGNRSYSLNISASGYLSRSMVVYVDTDQNVGDIELFPSPV